MSRPYLTMSIETKEIRLNYDDYLLFGWKHQKDVRRGNARCHHTVHILERDKDMPNYAEIKDLERSYFALKSLLQIYKPADPALCALLFCLLIIPLAIYLSYKSSQKNKIANSNAEIKKKMHSIKEKAQTLLEAPNQNAQ